MPKMVELLLYLDYFVVSHDERLVLQFVETLLLNGCLFVATLLHAYLEVPLDLVSTRIDW